jgi:hypothetical protein
MPELGVSATLTAGSILAALPAQPQVAIAALSELTAPEARVLRDGVQRTAPAPEVVAGDALAAEPAR